ncbi:MAG: ATP-binding protein [Desulfobacteraceae bacterium]|nr:MAG: ATP-binding protein [Desulfobacteraceae bacterium]
MMDTYKPRIIEDRLVELFRYYPVVAVLGARQVGKSTLVENLFGNRVDTVVFDPVVDIENARQDPVFFLQNHPPPVFFDEIQSAPELLGPIKRQVDRLRQKGLYILSGSQHLSVMRDIAESLAGRVALVHLYPMTWRELAGVSKGPFLEKWMAGNGDINAIDGVNDVAASDVDDRFTADRQPAPKLFPLIWRGGYPGVMDLPDNLAGGYWQSYLQTYIERDVRSVANIVSLQTFGQFIRLLAAMSAQEINYAHLGRELGMDRKTAQAWLETTASTFLWINIPAFSRNPIKRIAGRGKGYFADTGFVCQLQKISTPDAIGGHPLLGALFETWVVMEIIKTIQAWPTAPNIYHFRSYGGAEVDLVLEFNGTLYPIEIKSKSNPTRNDGRGIGAFRECFPRERIGPGLIICAVEKPARLSDNLLAVPWWMM